MRPVLIVFVACLIGLAPVGGFAQGQAQGQPQASASADRGELGRYLGVAFGMGAGALFFNAMTTAFNPGLPTVTGVAGAARNFALGADYGFQTGLWHGIGIVLTSIVGGAVGNWLYNK